MKVFGSSKGVLRTMGAALLAIALLTALMLGMAACGGDDEASTEAMQNALSVVENDIATLQADFVAGQKTGADVKAALVAVAPHWQAIVDACEGVGADKAEAEQLWSDFQQVADGLADEAGLAELVVLLPPLTAIQDYMGELRDKVGYPAGVEVTEGATTTTELVTTTTVPEGIDPELIGTWYSDYMEETLSYGLDGTLVVTWDGGDNSETFSYTAENGTTIDGAGNRVPYTINGDSLVIQDSEEGSQTYIRVN